MMKRVAACMLMLALLLCGCQMGDAEYDVRKLNWGDKEAQVAAAEGAEPVYSDEEIMLFEGDDAGLKADVIYTFSDGKLVSVRVDYTESNNAGYMFELVKNYYSGLYGDSVQSSEASAVFESENTRFTVTLENGGAAETVYTMAEPIEISG